MAPAQAPGRPEGGADGGGAGAAARAVRRTAPSAPGADADACVDGLCVVSADEDGDVVGHALPTRCRVGDVPALLANDGPFRERCSRGTPAGSRSRRGRAGRGQAAVRGVRGTRTLRTVALSGHPPHLPVSPGSWTDANGDQYGGRTPAGGGTWWVLPAGRPASGPLYGTAAAVGSLSPRLSSGAGRRKPLVRTAR